MEAVIEDTFTSKLYAYWPYDTFVYYDTSMTEIYTPAGDTEPCEAKQTLISKVSGIDRVLSEGSTGNTVVYRASMPT